jgi:hypothetical protein
MALVVVLAFTLEAGQLLVAGRHAMVADAMLKAISGVLGSAAGQSLFPLRRRWIALMRPVAAPGT